MRSISALLLASIVAGTSVPAEANDALKRCRGVTDAGARLACYDAIPVDTPAASPGPRIASPPAPPAPPSTARIGPAPLPAGSVAAPAPVQGSLESSFGMEGRAPAAELPAIQSHIPGTFYGWSQGTQITLANGQVWQVVEDEGGRRMQLQDPKVRVRRGLMGAFYLEFEAHNYSPRVRRIR